MLTMWVGFSYVHTYDGQHILVVHIYAFDLSVRNLKYVDKIGFSTLTHICVG